MIEQFPELADQGFWYVFEAVQVPHRNTTVTTSPVADVGPGSAAWYGQIDGTEYVVVRTPSPLVGVPEAPDVSVSEVLAVSSVGGSVKPFGRIGGS